MSRRDRACRALRSAVRALSAGGTRPPRGPAAPEPLEPRRLMAGQVNFGSDPSEFTDAGTGFALFTAFVGEAEQLFRTDGTPAGTALVKAVNTGGSTADVRGLNVAGPGIVRFSVGAERWQSDGTADGTYQIVPGAAAEALPAAAAAGLSTTSGTPTGVEVNGRYVYRVTTPPDYPAPQPSDSLYSWDGTGDHRRLDGEYQLRIGNLTRSGPYVYYTRQVGIMGLTYLWRTDGTAEGTRSVPLPYQQAGLPWPSPRRLTDVAGTLYFVWAGGEYWRTDGTAAGSYMLGDLNPNGAAADPPYDAVRTIGSLGSLALLSVNDGVHGAEPWVSDGTPAGTRMLADLNTAPFPGPPPTASAGGPYTVTEGGAAQLAGTRAGAGRKTIFYTEWDFDYDGVTFTRDASFESSPTFSAAALDGPATRTVAFRVTDSAGLTAIATATVTVTNAAPTATFAAGSAVRAGQASAVSFTGATDPSAADVAAGLRYSVDFNNDGDFADAGDVSDSTSATAARAFAAAGTYTVRGRVADKDGGATEYTTTVTVLPPLPPPVLSRRAAADAHVRNGPYANANYGLAGVLEVRKSSYTGNTREAYLRFDLTGVPSADAIGSAKVRLWGRVSAGTATPTVGVGLYSVASTTWTEGGLRWNTKPVAATSALSVKTVRGTAGAWYEFDVTAFLRARKAAGATSVGFALKGTAFGTPWAAFNSDEAAGNRPELRVTSR